MPTNEIKINTRVTRSVSRNSIKPENVKTPQKTKQTKKGKIEIIVIDSDSDSETNVKNAYRNRKVDLPKLVRQNISKGPDVILKPTRNGPVEDILVESNVNSSKSSLKNQKDNQPKLTNKNTARKVKNVEISETIEENKMHVTPYSSPRKKKSLSMEAAVTPPKQSKLNNENIIFSPSTLFEKLDLNSSPTKKFHSKKNLFDVPSQYQNARKALHSTVPVEMPGREKEHEELRTFMKDHLVNKTSGTLYVSGPPGTGKTASLSTILQQQDIVSEFKEVYVNCTAIKSSGTIYSRIVKELGLKCSGKAEKDYIAAIEAHLNKNHKMILLVLDEIDQLESKKQSVLYTIFEWPSKPNSRIVLIGIANALDLTDRILPRLQARCELKPKLMHFAPYTKQQIIEIFTNRLKAAGVLEMFTPVAVQMLAGKVASISGDVRRALDIGRRVIELVEQHKKQDALTVIDNVEPEKTKVDLKHVVGVLNSVYGTTNNLNDDSDDSFPLQQKIIICTLLLILKKARNKDVTIGKLHEIYRKVCSKRNLLGVDQAEFVGLCSLIETKGILRVSGKKEPRLHKVTLEWDEEEVISALKDKQLMSQILQDDSVLGKL